MAKRNRETALLDRRERKAVRKAERKRAAAAAVADPSDAPAVDGADGKAPAPDGD
jgi:hypothetical protein